MSCRQFQISDTGPTELKLDALLTDDTLDTLLEIEETELTELSDDAELALLEIDDTEDADDKDDRLLDIEETELTELKLDALLEIDDTEDALLTKLCDDADDNGPTPNRNDLRNRIARCRKTPKLVLNTVIVLIVP